MKKLFILFVALFATTNLFANGVEINGIHYLLNGDTAVVTYTGTSYMDNSYFDIVVIPSSVTYNGKTYSVTTIGNDAFNNCSYLISVKIPNSVTTIENMAFHWCPNLISVKIPDSVTSIGDEVFYGCSGLTSVTIPNSVTTIGNRAFCYCNNLTTPLYNVHCFAYMPTSYKGTYTIPDGIQQIAGGAFYWCDGLTSVIIPNSVTTIGKSAFERSSNLKSVTIPNSVTTIGDGAFYECSSLISINVDVTNIHYSDAAGVLFNYAKDTLIQYPIGNTRTTYAIPNSVTTIGKNAFCSCKRLTSVSIGNSVTTIGNSAFYNCTGLTSVSIGNSVTTIGNSAFELNSNLKSVTCYTIAPPTCKGNCFYIVSKSIPIYVPACSIEAYKNANDWKDFNKYYSVEAVSVFVNNAAYGYVQGGGHQQSENVILTAQPKYGYHFVHWNDGNTDNPRMFILKQDTAFTAEFAINIYFIEVQVSDSVMGSVIGANDNYEHGTSLTLTATPNYGYHFDQWDDGNKQNSRTITIIQDTNFVAYFAKNVYKVTTYATNGQVQGNKQVEYLDTCTLVATPNYGYHFSRWIDGNSDNPRKIEITRDTAFTAEFAKNSYSFEVKANNDKRGSVKGSNGSYEYQTQLTISATAHIDLGYHFAQWSDGNKQNPRTLKLTQDTVIIAHFAENKCGDNLMWYLKDGALQIIGTGAMYDSGFDSWSRWADQITSISLPEGLTHIGDNAFMNCSNVQKIEIPTTVTSIGNYAFSGCTGIRSITCFAEQVPTAENYTFYGLSQYTKAYVMASLLEDYQFAMGWRDLNLQPIGATEPQTPVEEGQVIVIPADNRATFTWPVNPSADGYILEITKDGEVFCTLKFNAQGQLTGIAFAPGRGGAREMASAEMTTNGWQFTVTGLNQSSKYGYTLDATNANQQSIKHYEGEFTTTGVTGLEWLTFDNARCIMKKMIIDNQLFIFRNGKTYNAAGVEL